jgi:hypothetical protein
MIRPALHAAGALLLLTMPPAFAADSAASATRARRIARQCVLPNFPPVAVSEVRETVRVPGTARP